MTYHHAHDSAHTVRLHGLGDLSAGDKITLRFRPGAGVNQRNAVRILDELRTALLGTNHFTSPTYLGWGTGGTLVYRGSVRSANYTLRQVANMMPAITLRVATRAGLPVTFLSALDSDGDERVAEQPDAAPPGGSTPGGATTGGGATPGGATPGGAATPGDVPAPDQSEPSREGGGSEQGGGAKKSIIPVALITLAFGGLVILWGTPARRGRSRA
jgi:hypothetical protein